MPLSANWGLWFGAVVVAVAPFVIFSDSQDWHEKEWAFKLLFPFILIFLAERARKLAFLNRFDISYGVYIYSFLIQQSIVALAGLSLTPIELSLMTVIIVTPIAYLSWIFVERPALKMKVYFQKKLSSGNLPV